MKDFFISYNSADQTWAEWIAWQLEEAHYTTVLQAWDFLPGENFVLRMHEAAKDTRSTIIVLSPAFLNSDFTQPEWAAAFRKDPQGKARQLIPVRIAECEPEGLLGSIVYIDWVGSNETEAREKLLHGIKAKRKKPWAKPFFPGASRRSVLAVPDYPGLGRSAIKYLRPFEFEDAELFRRLQREGSLQECLEAISDRDFRFGILSGESGCGKTSFLQAGLRPRLLAHTVPHRCVYVKLTDLDPLDSLRQALTNQLQLPKESLAGLDLLPLLAVAVQADHQPLVLLFDQFEQFFAHRKLREEREPFVNALAKWHKSKPPLPCKMIVCIRGDFKYRLDELQKAMGYALGPQQNFSLEKFTPTEAAQIFRVMAETEGLACDENFVKELAEQELASREDGLISPVDIQILAWMIKGQKAVAERAFNRQVYQKLGGIAGLLEKYLERALEARETEDRREAAIKVLWALTDWERNIRAGVLTVDDLANKLAGTVSPEKMQEAVDWLGRSDVRLITPSKRNDTAGYELAHERLIPALRRLAGKKFSAADQANQLLERRVNEWLGNERAGRYLLGWQEMRLIDRQKPYLIWGQRKTQKQDLLHQSRHRLWYRAGLASIPLIFILAFLLWWQSPWGQIYWVKKDLISLSKKVNDEEVLKEVATAFALIGEFDQARQIAEKIPDDDYEKASVLAEVAAAAAKMGESTKVIAFLQQVSQIAEKIPDGYLKTLTLSKVAAAAAKMGETTKAAAFLQQAAQSAEKIPDDDIGKASALSSVSVAAAKMGETIKAIAFLQQAAQIPEKIPDVYYGKASVLAEVAAAAAKMGETTKAIAFLQQVSQIAEKIPDNNEKASALSYVATAAAKMGETTKAIAFLQQAGQIAEKIPDDNQKASALLDIAAAAAKMGETTKAVAFLQQAGQIAEKISDGYRKASALSNVVVAAAKMGETTKDVAFLQQAGQIAEKISDGYRKASALSNVVVAAAKMGETTKDVAFLQQAGQIAEKIPDDNQKASALLDIAAAAAKMGETTKAVAFLQQAGQTAEKIPYDDYRKAYALSYVATAAAKMGETTKAVAFLQQAGQIAEKITDNDHYDRKASVLWYVAAAAAKMGNWQQARKIAESNVTDANKAKALAAILKVWGKRQYPALAETEAEEK